MAKAALRCPRCMGQRLRATGVARGAYDDMVEVRCVACGKVWMSTSDQARGMLRTKRGK